jgi:hypothetical protein
MNSKNVLVFLAGAAVAYFVIKQMDKMKTSPVPVPPVDTVDTTACEEALNTELMTMRFASDSEREAFIQEYMDNCLRGDTQESGNGNGCAQGLIACTNQPVGGALKCYDPNVNYAQDPCA